jgi:hypothetical protein
MASFIIAAGICNDLANKLNDDLDGGKLQIYTGTSPGPNNAATGTKLAEFSLPAKTANTVANGVLTFGTIAPVNALADGTAGYHRLLKADGTVVADGDVGISGSTLDLNTTNIVSGVPVAVTAYAVTVQPGT